MAMKAAALNAIGASLLMEMWGKMESLENEGGKKRCGDREPFHKERCVNIICPATLHCWLKRKIIIIITTMVRKALIFSVNYTQAVCGIATFIHQCHRVADLSVCPFWVINVAHNNVAHKTKKHCLPWCIASMQKKQYHGMDGWPETALSNSVRSKQGELCLFSLYDGRSTSWTFNSRRGWCPRYGGADQGRQDSDFLLRIPRRKSEFYKKKMS